MQRYRILLAENQSQVLQFLRVFPEPKYDVVGAVQDQHMLLIAARVLQPDIAIVDLEMPGLKGIKSIRQLQRRAPGCHVVLRSSHAKPDRMAKAYAAGVAVYLVKEPTLSWTFALRTIIEKPQWIGEWKTVHWGQNHQVPEVGCGVAVAQAEVATLLRVRTIGNP